jgi:hypothetical protein
VQVVGEPAKLVSRLIIHDGIGDRLRIELQVRN